MKEFWRLALNRVTDELEDPADGEQHCRHRPEAAHEHRDDEQRNRQRDERNTQRVTEPIDGVLMTARVLRDPVIPGLAGKHAS